MTIDGGAPMPVDRVLAHWSKKGLGSVPKVSRPAAAGIIRDLRAAVCFTVEAHIFRLVYEVLDEWWRDRELLRSVLPWLVLPFDLCSFNITDGDRELVWLVKRRPNEEFNIDFYCFLESNRVTDDPIHLAFSSDFTFPPAQYAELPAFVTPPCGPGVWTAGRLPEIGLFQILGQELAGILALLQARAVVQDRIVKPQGRHRIAGKSVPYMAHRTLKIEVPRELVVQRVRDLVGKGRAAVSPMRHEVMAHWCERRRPQHCNCEHEWRAGGDAQHRVCVRCGCPSWLRKAHVRGDASKGFRTHSYELVAADARPRA